MNLPEFVPINLPVSNHELSKIYELIRLYENVLEYNWSCLDIFHLTVIIPTLPCGNNFSNSYTGSPKILNESFLVLDC